MPDMIYLDNASTSFPKPGVVYDYMCEFYRTHGVNPGRAGYNLSVEVEEVVSGTRKMLMDLFGGTAVDHLTFSYNASDSLNMIIQGLAERGDHVVTTNIEHNSVLRPLWHLKRDGVIDVTCVPFGEGGYLDPEDISAAIRRNTKMVVVNHASNVVGTVQPVAEIGGICRQAGVYLVVDASQTAGTHDIDVGKMGIDLLAFTGHKCLLGPTGIGGSYIGDDVAVRGTRYGGTGECSEDPFHPEEFPHRMECGTLNIVGVAGLRAGLEWLYEQGTGSVYAEEMRLWKKLRDALEAMENVTLYCADSPRNHIAVLSFNVEGWEAGDVGTILDRDYSIACRTGLHCAPLVHKQLGTDKAGGTVRLSIGPFNTEAHIDLAIEAVGAIAATRRPAARI